MIFTIRQLQEKCQEQRKDLFQVFIDLTKAFDTVNRETLWLIPGKLGCPEKLIFILRISKDSQAFGILHKRLWSRHGISKRMKVKVYNACVLTVFLYASETWITYSRHLTQLERFHQQCLRKNLGIKWQMHISDTKILEMANICSTKVLVSKQQLRWSGVR